MSTLSNEPVVTAASVAALISAIIVFVRSMGWLVLSDDQFANLMAMVAIALPIIGAVIARRFVTPLAAPKDNAGNALVPQQDAGRG